MPIQCSSCSLTSNLWLCLTCGLANCGRQQHGGIGGKGHAVAHFQDTGHTLGVKLGTITSEGTGGKLDILGSVTLIMKDIYCYLCDDAKLDPDLPTHLRAFGIDVMGQTKTEKSMTELVSRSETSSACLDVSQQLEHNLKYDFSMTGDDGQELEPLFGQGITGLKNLGNR